MKKLVILLYILTISVYSQSQNNIKINHQTNFREVYNQLINLEPFDNKIAEVNDFVICRDVARFEMKKGKLFLLSPVNNKIVAAVFVGEGKFSFKPSSKIEQDQLFRFYGKREYNDEIESFVFIFNDNTLQEIQENLVFIDDRDNDASNNEIDDCLDYMKDEESSYFDLAILKSLLDNRYNELFFAYIELDKEGPLFFKINPYEEEEISLSHEAETSILYDIPEIICQFQQYRDYSTTRYGIKENKDLIKITNYKINMNLDNDLEFSAETEIKLNILKPNQNWIYFNLFYDLEVESVFWEKGRKASFFKGEENNTLWIQLDSPITSTEDLSVKILYSGDLIKRVEDWFKIRSSSYWYPRYSGRNLLAKYDITVSIPKYLQAVCTGDQISNEIINDKLVSNWITKEPIRNASFNIGYYDEYELSDIIETKNIDIPPIKIFKAKYGHVEIGKHLMAGSDMEVQVGTDILNAFTFFQKVYGKVPVKNFYATEIPYLHGQAFPGLILLPWSTFHNTSESGFDELFRAHEVAHQWWGIAVDFETYHDQWLSEAMAQFSGLWYLQTMLNDNDKYFLFLNRWKDEIINNRDYFIAKAQESGPIWLGYRTSSSKTRGDYNLIIYKKGAWVLHMLRNMMIDLKTMNEDGFLNMMKDFYNSFVGKKVSTSDFQEVVENHFGQDMDWFFNQWVYGTQIPHYQVHYQMSKIKENNYEMVFKVRQLNVDKNFKMSIPICIDFGDKGIFRFKVFIQEYKSKFTIPNLPYKPEKVIFNDLNSVLCEVDYVDWEINFFKRRTSE